ncbi:hypothetical protein C8R45DRAFT_1153244 [Mycena sanguinolenta]|nr:hypothetical protein C8R45DRAFT_1153244 [Mycena sanguinolenta]
MSTLHESTSRAESLCSQCATTPSMNALQPIAVSAVELCRAAAAADLFGNHTSRMEKLARAFTVAVPQSLERIEAKLGEIRRVIEHLPSKGKLIKDFSVNRETNRLKKELKAFVDTHLKGTHNIPAAASKGISSMELANLTVRAASAICEAPVLNFLKPVVGIAEIISETARTVKSNRAAALQLASHSSMVTKSIVEHAARLELNESATPSNDQGLIALKSVLESIHLHLGDLQKPRRFRSWIMANKEKDRIDEFNKGLDRALALFTSTNVLSTRAEVREIETLVRGDGSVEEIAIQVRMNTDVLTAVQAELAAALSMSAPAVLHTSLIESKGEKQREKPLTTALVPFSTAVAQLTFFFSRSPSHSHATCLRRLIEAVY